VDNNSIKAYSLALQTMWAAATDLEGQECLSMASLATTKDHVAI